LSGYDALKSTEKWLSPGFFAKTMESAYRKSKPGVYALKTKSGKTNYIGKVKANRLKQRIAEHMNAGEIPFSRVAFKSAKSHALAKAKEKKLIRKVNPPYNKLLKKAKRYP
jgi:excinuclease UvrABC nuclease subunit